MIIHSIKILDDHEWIGEGEFEFKLTLSRKTPECDDLIASKGICEVIGESDVMKFDADSGELEQVEHAIPDGGMASRSGNAFLSVQTGFPVWRDQVYWMVLKGSEVDSYSREDAGSLIWELSWDNGWDLGSRTERALKSASYSGGAGTEVSYEIRMIPLPELEARMVNIVQPTESEPNHRVCTRVENLGSLPAGGFQVVYRMDGALLPNGLINHADGLAPKGSVSLCATTKLPTQGTHTITVDVDEAGAVAELYEHNNRFTGSYEGVAPAATLADLTVESILVQGHEPSGLNDCDPGKNDIVVKVKNGGVKPVGPFAARVVTDDDDTYEETATSLDAGKTVDLIFDKVKFKKGEHTIQATADPLDRVVESSDTNNSKTVTAWCRDESSTNDK